LAAIMLLKRGSMILRGELVGFVTAAADVAETDGLVMAPELIELDFVGAWKGSFLSSDSMPATPPLSTFFFLPRPLFSLSAFSTDSAGFVLLTATSAARSSGSGCLRFLFLPKTGSSSSFASVSFPVDRREFRFLDGTTIEVGYTKRDEIRVTELLNNHAPSEA
jgi:hypothetical protein